MKTILLCRVSSKEQEESGYSLPAQEKLLTAYAEKHMFKIAKIFSISESASGKKQREIFDEMMVFAQKQNIKVIVCEKVDRLTRNFKDAVMIDEWLDKDGERQVHLVKDSLVLHKNSRSQEKLNWGIRILFAKNYIDNLSEEVKKGQKEKIAQGWLPTKPPLGYKTIGEKGHKIHIIDEEKAPLIRKMFQLYETGNYSVKRLTEKMDQEGLRNITGTKVVKSRIHTLLTDPFYFGKIRWNDELYEGKHESLVSKETFNNVQRILKSKTTPKYHKHLFLFRGIIKCSECGGLITWETAKGHIYGHCNHYRSCSQKVWSKENEVEEQLLGTFENLQIKNSRLADWILKALKESHKDEIAFHSSAVNELYTNQKQAKQRLDRLYDDKLDGKITEDFYQKKFKQYTEDLDKVCDSLKRHNNASSQYFELGINIYELSQKSKEIYLKANPDTRRQLLNLVFENLALDEGKLSYHYTQTFEVLSKAVEFTNGSKITKIADKEDKSFELSKSTELWGQTEDFSACRSTLLRR